MQSQSNIRNFCIISHIDHGKSTLADRLLEMTGTVDSKKMRSQYLDMMDLEREKGITIKMQPVRMVYSLNATPYILNLIDTPGHVDFNYEVSRSLAAVEGAILLVDASKGVQAQTVSNLELAKRQNLVIIPAINKIDLPQARVKEVGKEISDLLPVVPGGIIKISAKEGTNVEQVLQAVIKKIPPPKESGFGLFRGLIFDSKYDPYKGVIAYTRIFDGEIKKGQTLYLIQSKAEGEVREIGVFKPELAPVEKLGPGDIGYIATSIKEPAKVRVGDTITISTNFKTLNLPLPGYQEPKPMVFLSIYPEDPDDFELLKEALGKLKLNDASLIFKPEVKEGLGRGFQCGFLGLLHTEIVAERLKREFNLNLVLSTPQVSYKAIAQDNQDFFIYSSRDWSDSLKVKETQEQWVKVQVLTPFNYLGRVSELFKGIESRYIKQSFLGTEKSEISYEVPLREIVVKNFYDRLKSVSQGFASMDYEVLDWRTVDLVKLDILILGKKEEAFSRILPSKEAYKEGKRLVEKLKEILPSQQFSVPLQAVVGGKIIARETMKAERRDVTAPLYGGDYTRKRKLLEKQKKGKKELKEKGRIRIPPETYLKILSG